MKNNIQEFLQSGLLERYLVGDTSIAQNLEVENLINTHPEISKAYDKLQENLEIISKANAVEAPLGSLNSILKATTTNTPVIPLPKQNKPWLSIAASVAALVFAASTVYLYIKNEKLLNENEVVVEEIFDLRDDIYKNNSKLDALAVQLEKLNNPDALKYVLEGNERAKDLKTVAYINPINKTSMIDVVSLPKLPDNQRYQLRVELEDKMVSMGYLEDYERTLKQIPYLEDALALSIAIEDKAGDMSINHKEVAKISLKK